MAPAGMPCRHKVRWCISTWQSIRIAAKTRWRNRWRQRSWLLPKISGLTKRNLQVIWFWFSAVMEQSQPIIESISHWIWKHDLYFAVNIREQNIRNTKEYNQNFSFVFTGLDRSSWLIITPAWKIQYLLLNSCSVDIPSALCFFRRSRFWGNI